MRQEWIWGEMVGEGAFAKVYRVQEKKSGRILACKMAQTVEGMAILKQEAGLHRLLEHPLFVRYVDFVQEQNSAMLFMEFADGENLGELLDRQGALPQERAVRIAAWLAEGLRYLHESPQPMLYRDLKPEHVYIGKDDTIKLLDLGCACRVEDAGRSRAGSRGYAAWEQLQVQEGAAGSPAQGPYSDVYALGKLLHYMLTGQNPCHPPFIKHSIRAYDPTLSALLERLVDQCTKEDPAERLPDMRSVMRQLEPFLNRKKSAVRLFREWSALVEWHLSGRRWENDFVFERCVFKKPEIYTGCERGGKISPARFCGTKREPLLHR